MDEQLAADEPENGRDTERRQSERVSWDQLVDLIVPSQITPLQVFGVDISEGGLSCAVPEALPRPTGDYLRVSMSLPASKVDSRAYIKWWSEEISSGMRKIGLEFDPTDEIARNTIRAHFLVLQEEMRRRIGE